MNPVEATPAGGAIVFKIVDQPATMPSLRADSVVNTASLAVNSIARAPSLAFTEKNLAPAT
jgi:hypothetical protein